MNPLLFAILKLLLLTLTGFLLFRHPFLQKRVYRPFLFITVNIGLPLYYIDKFARGWDAALEAGLQWALVFFIACLTAFAIHYLIARLLIPRLGLSDSGVRRDLTALITIHNAGYIPLPILTSLNVPPEILVYMFFYILAFQLTFWSLTVPLLTGDSRRRLRLSVKPPLAGLLVGLGLAIPGWSQQFPPLVMALPSLAGSYTMDAILLVLGGALAGIPYEKIRIHREFAPVFLFRYILFPFAVLLLVMLLPLPGVPEVLLPWFQLVLVIESAVPPGTNLILAARMWGSNHQVEYMGTAIIYSYLPAFITLPVFIFLCMR